MEIVKTWVLVSLFLLNFSSESFAGNFITMTASPIHEEAEKRSPAVIAEEQFEAMSENRMLFLETKVLDPDIKTTTMHYFLADAESILTPETDTGQKFRLVRSSEATGPETLEGRGPGWEAPDGTKWFGPYDWWACGNLGLDTPNEGDFLRLLDTFKTVPVFLSKFIPTSETDSLLILPEMHPDTRSAYFRNTASSYEILLTPRSLRAACIWKPKTAPSM